MDIHKAIHVAIKHQESGNVKDAELAYKKILELQPDNIDVLYALGEISFQNKQYDSAIDYIKKILQLNPVDAGAYNNLGIILQEKGQLDEAISYYQKALQVNPNLADAHNNSGLALQKKGELDNAVLSYQKAIGFNPNFIEAYCNLGNLFRDNNQLDEAITSYQKALLLNPNLVAIHNSIGICFYKKGKLGEAITHYQKAIDIDPNYSGAYSNLGVVFQNKGQLDNAIKCYSKALQLNPRFAQAFNNLGSIFEEKGHLDKAEEYYRHAIRIEPDNLLFSKSLLFQMLYNPKYDAESIFSEHLKLARQFAEPLSSSVSHHTNECIPNRRVKIGYVSPDFRRHSVAYFLEPALSAHNREHFEIFCYSDVGIPDEVTKRLQGFADQWRNIIGIPDEKVAGVIREDAIDILIDLAGHTASNRMLLFARKPAPVQASWIGYPATTGLSTMDYKIVDNYTDPLGITEQFYTEKLIRMPESFLCYLPDPDSPEVGTLPSLTPGYISFGSFNNFPKMTPKVISLWIRILKAVPDSHIVLKARSLYDEATREQALDMFTMEGIERQRINLHSWVPSAREHLKLYNQVDIALDTFPYHGTTTTCEALWMGVPVITLAGDTHGSRVGVSLLSNIGLKEFIAQTPEEYVEIAVDLARDTQRLQYLRQNLRDMMAHSPLMNAKQFIHNLEDRYRTMWGNWCKSV
jgi:protein O-GlcNAc transferase